jgi:hypothetical protein
MFDPGLEIGETLQNSDIVENSKMGHYLKEVWYPFRQQSKK